MSQTKQLRIFRLWSHTSYNGLKTLNAVFGKECKSNEEMLKYMHANKVECALKVFESVIQIRYPEYITKAIEHVEVAD